MMKALATVFLILVGVIIVGAPTSIDIPISVTCGPSLDGSVLNGGSGLSLCTVAGRWTFGPVQNFDANWPIQLNGVNQGAPAAIVLYILNNGVLYQQTASGLWYSWTGFGPWVGPIPDPRGGIVPGPAAAAGFNQLIISDNFQDPSFGTLSNWLDCASASSPLWWFGWVGFGTIDGHCFDITQATDPVGGQLAVRLHFQDSYWTNTNGVAAGTMMETTNSSGVGRRIPPGFYSEIVARTDVLTSNTGGSMDLWGLTITPGDYEIDGLEEFGPVSTIASNIHNAPTGFNNCARCASCPTAAVGGCGFDLTQYHIYAMRQTSGGTDRIFCAYIDGALQGCQTIQPNAQQLAGLPMVIQVGSYKSGGSNPIGGTGKNTWIKSVKVWSCAGVNSGAQCNSNSNNP